MKHIFLFSFSIAFSLPLFAQQSCCDKALKTGKVLYDNCMFDEAMKKFIAMKDGCLGCSQSEAQSWINKTNACLNNSNASGCPCREETTVVIPPKKTEPSPSVSNYTETVNGVSFVMKAIPAGNFTMGCTSEQGSDCSDDEKPAHSVTLSAFYMGETEVTQALWTAVMGNNPSYFKGDKLPIEQVSWNEVQDFIRKLNSMTGKTYKLPSEAQWEYAARGGQSYKYSGSNDLGSVAWFANNSENTTHTVKGKNANGYGLYDMSGNVWEWCEDYYHDNYTKNGNSEYQVCRGGSWVNDGYYCRASLRVRGKPANHLNGLGFRLLRGTL